MRSVPLFSLCSLPAFRGPQFIHAWFRCILLSLSRLELLFPVLWCGSRDASLGCALSKHWASLSPLSLSFRETKKAASLGNIVCKKLPLKLRFIFVHFFFLILCGHVCVVPIIRSKERRFLSPGGSMGELGLGYEHRQYAGNVCVGVPCNIQSKRIL